MRTRASLLAESAVDAFSHVNVVTGGATAPIRPLLRLNSDSLAID